MMLWPQSQSKYAANLGKLPRKLDFNLNKTQGQQLCPVFRFFIANPSINNFEQWVSVMIKLITKITAIVFREAT